VAVCVVCVSVWSGLLGGEVFEHVRYNLPAARSGRVCAVEQASFGEHGCTFGLRKNSRRVVLFDTEKRHEGIQGSQS
jgi:hypothetical protein